MAAIAALGASQRCPAQTGNRDRLVLVGTLGQSQPPQTPAPFLSAEGVEEMQDGYLWIGADRSLYEYARTQGGAWRLIRTVPLPAAITTDSGLQTRGDASLYAACGDGWIYRLDASQSASQPSRWRPLPPGARAFLVTPSGAVRGFACEAQAFALVDRAVIACRADGRNQVLALPKVEGGYQTIGLEPSSGDMLAASSYPDMHIYRYAPDGRQVVAGGWPRAGFAVCLFDVRGVAWALLAGGGASSLPADTNGGDFEHFETRFEYPARGFCAAAGGGYWLASSQGVSRLDAWGKPDGEHIGGLPGASQLAVTGDGRIVAATDGATRFVCLHIDDAPGDAICSDGNAPWTTAGKRDIAGGVTRSGNECLVVDKSRKSLFRFRPEHEASEDEPWVEVAAAAPLADPSAIAGGEQRVWVVDSDQILESPLQEPLNFRPAALPAYAAPDAPPIIAASPNESLLFVASPNDVSCFRRNADGAYDRAWKAGLSGVVSLAASDHDVFAVMRGEPSIAVIDISTGGATIQKTQDPGETIVYSAIAYHNGYVVAADSAGCRLLVYRVARVD